MVLFGTALPWLIAWFSAKWLASRLKHWWGNIISVVISFLLGTIIPLAIYAAYSEVVGSQFDGGIFVKIFANAIIISAFVSIWSVVRTKKALARKAQPTTPS